MDQFTQRSLITSWCNRSFTKSNLIGGDKFSDHNNPESPLKLLDGTVLDHPTAYSHTPLMFAVYNENLEAVKYLVNVRQVNPTDENYSSLTALDLSLLLNSNTSIKGLLALHFYYGDSLTEYIERRIALLQGDFFTNSTETQAETLFVTCLFAVTYLGRFRQVRNAVLVPGVLDCIMDNAIWKGVSLHIKSEFCLNIAAHLFYDNDIKGMTKLIKTKWAEYQFENENNNIEIADTYSMDRFLAIISFFASANEGVKWICTTFLKYPKLGIRLADFDLTNEKFVAGFYKEICKILKEFNIEKGFVLYKNCDPTKMRKLFATEKDLKIRINKLIPLRNEIVKFLKEKKFELKKEAIKTTQSVKTSNTEADKLENNRQRLCKMTAGQEINVNIHNNVNNFEEQNEFQFVTRKNFRKLKKENKAKQSEGLTPNMTDKQSCVSKHLLNHNGLNFTKSSGEKLEQFCDLKSTPKKKSPKIKSYPIGHPKFKKCELQLTNSKIDKQNTEEMMKSLEPPQKESNETQIPKLMDLDVYKTIIFDADQNLSNDKPKLDPKKCSASNLTVKYTSKIEKKTKHDDDIEQQSVSQHNNSNQNYCKPTNNGDCEEYDVKNISCEYKTAKHIDETNFKPLNNGDYKQYDFNNTVNTGHQLKQMQDHLVSDWFSGLYNSVFQPLLNANPGEPFLKSFSGESSQALHELHHKQNVNAYARNLFSTPPQQTSITPVRQSVQMPPYVEPLLKPSNGEPSVQAFTPQFMDPENLFAVNPNNNPQNYFHDPSIVFMGQSSSLVSSFSQEKHYLAQNLNSYHVGNQHINDRPSKNVTSQYVVSLKGMADVPANFYESNCNMSTQEKHESHIVPDILPTARDVIASNSMEVFPSAAHEPIPKMLLNLLKGSPSSNENRNYQDNQGSQDNNYIYSEKNVENQQVQEASSNNVRDENNLFCKQLHESSSTESGYLSPPLSVPVPKQRASTQIFIKNWGEGRSHRWNSLLKILVHSPTDRITRAGTINFLSNDQSYLAKGSCGTVVRAGIRDDGLEVAVKCMLKTHTGLISNELKSLRKLYHPNIIQYIDYIEDDKFSYVILELCEFTLDQYIYMLKERNQLQLHSRHLGLQLISGLKVLHDVKVLHMDLKPRNVLIDINGNIRLADFGLSHRLNGEQDTFYHSSVHGTKCWRAPETIGVPYAGQDGNCGRYKQATDIYVAGMILYFIVTGGNHPFGEEPSMCEMNILRGCQPNTSTMKDDIFIDLFKAMVKPDMNSRVSTDDCLKHPFFWDDQKRFEFLVAVGGHRDVAARVSNQLIKLTELLLMTKASTSKWVPNIEETLVQYMGWEGLHLNSVLDLLTIVIPEVDERSQQIAPLIEKATGLGPATYILKSFPGLFLAVYQAVIQVKWQRQHGLRHYFRLK